MNPAAHIIMCAGVLALAIQIENWMKPPVVHRIVEAAKIKQRLVQIVEIQP